MGWWRCEHGIIGDGPADVLDDAFKRIEKLYISGCHRPPTQGELANLIEFCSCSILKPICGDPKYPFTNENNIAKDTTRASKRGRQGASSPESIAAASEGKMANVDPSTGINFPASLGGE